jgi:hypothetical protein
MAAERAEVWRGMTATEMAYTYDETVQWISHLHRWIESLLAAHDGVATAEQLQDIPRIRAHMDHARSCRKGSCEWAVAELRS